MNFNQELINEEVERLRNTRGVGLCPECGEPFTHDFGPAQGGSIDLGCANGHRWTATMDFAVITHVDGTTERVPVVLETHDEYVAWNLTDSILLQEGDSIRFPPLWEHYVDEQGYG